MRESLLAVAAALLALASGQPLAVRAQSYPQQPIRLVVPFPPGGGADILARVVADKLAEPLRTQVIIDNRPGVGGMIGSQFVARSAPDGYTLVFATSSSHAVNPHLVKSGGYDALRDFTPIILVAQAPNALVTHPSVPVRTVKELIAFAKGRPGELNIASNGNGSLSHLMAELFMLRAGVKLVHVPYKGAAPAVTDTIAGNVSMLFASYPSVASHVQARRLRALAVTGAKRTPTAPDLPTISESALPGFEANQWWGISGPAGLPAAIVSKLNAETARILRYDDVKKRFASTGADIVGGTPADMAGYQKADFERWGEVAKAAGLRAD